MRRRPGSTTPRQRTSRPASARTTATIASAPGKIILLGEHAVVFGEPALAVAVDLRTWVRCVTSDVDRINEEPLEGEAWPYVGAAAATARGRHALTIGSDIPSKGGMGSSAAVTVACLAALHPRWSATRIAQAAYGVEVEVQGRASPIDTSTATHGRGVFVDGALGPRFLWSVAGPSGAWNVHHVDVPPLDLLVANTGIRPPTGELVAGVRRRVEGDPSAHRAVRKIGAISRQGLGAMERGDLGALGRLMDEDHALLNQLGVGHPRLDEFVAAVHPYAYGAKLTGAGGGGNMVALVRDRRAAVEAIRSLGVEPAVVRPAPQGVEVHGEPR